MTSINQPSSRTSAPSKTGIDQFRNRVKMAFGAIMVAAPILFTPAAQGAENTVKNRITEAKTLEKATLKNNAKIIHRDFSEKYPQLYKFLLEELPKNPTFENIKKHVFAWINSQIDFMNHLKRDLALESIYQKGKSKDRFYALDKGNNQIQEEIKALERIGGAIEARDHEYTMLIQSISEKEEMDMRHFQLLEESIKEWNEIQITDKENTEWKKELENERKKIGYTYKDFFRWKIQNDKQIKDKREDGIIHRNIVWPRKIKM